MTVAIITPDKDIIPDAENLSPAYIVFNNYEIILATANSNRHAASVSKSQSAVPTKFPVPYCIACLLLSWSHWLEYNESLGTSKASATPFNSILSIISND